MASMEPLSTTRSPRPFDPSKAAVSTLIPLESVQIATPCHADWSKMQGDDKSRFCHSCQKSVYNLSAMTTPEAQALIEEKGGNLCARIYRRADGTLITGDCPVGQTSPRLSLWSAAAGTLAAVSAALLSGCGVSSSAASSDVSLLDTLRNVPVLSILVNLVSPSPPPVTPPTVSPMMGTTRALPAPTATPSPTLEPKSPATPEGSATMGEAVALPVLGRIACTRPSAQPKPTTAPEPTATPKANA